MYRMWMLILSVAVATTPASAADEAAALEFARTHHEALADLMEGLRDRSPGEFQKAVGDVDRVRIRLSRMKDETRRKAELQRWILRSRLQVETARLAAHRNRDGEESKAAAARIEARMQTLAEDWIALEEARLAREEQTLAAQLKKVREQRATIEADRASAVEAVLRRYLASADAAARRSRNKAGKRRPADDKKSNAPKSATGT